VADSEEKTIQTPPESTCYWGDRGTAAAVRPPRAQTPANRLIKARREKEGQRRIVIIPAGEVTTTTIGCNCLDRISFSSNEDRHPCVFLTKESRTKFANAFEP
jgi:hypothetical protein